MAGSCGDSAAEPSCSPILPVTGVFVCVYVHVCVCYLGLMVQLIPVIYEDTNAPLMQSMLIFPCMVA